MPYNIILIQPTATDRFSTSIEFHSTCGRIGLVEIDHDDIEWDDIEAEVFDFEEEEDEEDWEEDDDL